MSAQTFHGSHVGGDVKSNRGVHGADVNSQRGTQNGMGNVDNVQQGYQSQKDPQVR